MQTMVTVPERVYSGGTLLSEPEQLQRIFRAIARAATQEDIQAAVMPKVQRLFGANRAGLFLEETLSADPRVVEVARTNPVVRYLRERHAPIHEAAILTAGEWAALCPRADHGHVLLGPVIMHGEIGGVLGITRMAGELAFGSADIGHIAAICLHLGNWLTAAPATTSALSSLTPREQQLARLVSEGLTNAQIGQRLCISPETVKAGLKRIFQKLDIQKRSALASMVSERKLAG